MLSIEQVIYPSFALSFSFSIAILAKIFSNTFELKFLLFYISLSIFAYIFTIKTIPIYKNYLIRANLFGLDINKKGTLAGEKKIPEALGVVPATIFLILAIIGSIFIKLYNPAMIFEHICSLISISFVIFLVFFLFFYSFSKGFSDDVLDLPWRYKLILPTVASIPLLIAYPGTTVIVLPNILRFLYYIYMGMLAIFCTNSINIYAGINGLEVSQSIIIGLSILLHNTIEITQSSCNETFFSHAFSLTVIIPYLFTTLALFKYNKFPSEVFVGDTFCYWSGMTFAVCGILGHFSKTLLLFFLPQILNFLYSCPQVISFLIEKLFKFIPCPKHRLPKRYNKESDKLEGISNNLTLINLFLLLKGPTKESDTVAYLVIFQIFCCGFGFILRYYFAFLLYEDKFKIDL